MPISVSCALADCLKLLTLSLTSKMATGVPAAIAGADSLSKFLWRSCPGRTTNTSNAMDLYLGAYIALCRVQTQSEVSLDAEPWAVHGVFFLLTCM